MAKDCETVEQMMAQQNCTGRRVTIDSIKAKIMGVHYHTCEIAGQKVMFCGIKMDNGFVVIGKPATCIDPDNWRDSIGQKISYDNAFDELWRLEAYRLLSLEKDTAEFVEEMLENVDE